MNTMEKLGALWLKEGKKGKFMSGDLRVGADTIPVLIFKNQYKTAANHPDYVVMRPVADPQGGEHGSGKETGTPDGTQCGTLDGTGVGNFV